MKKVLIISTEFPPGPGGIGQHAFSLAKALFYEGYLVKVLSPGDHASFDEISIFDSKQLFEIKRYKRKHLFYTYIVRIITSIYQIYSLNFTVVFLTGKFSLWQGIFIKLIFPKIKSIAILHGSEINLKNLFLRKITHYSISKADKIISVSNFSKSLLPESIRKKNNSILVIPNGIDIDTNTQLTNPKCHLKGFPKLLTVGHVSPRKGQHRVIKALPRLIENWPNLIYHIVGRPINQKSLEDLAEKLNVKNHIIFHGVIDSHSNLINYYSQVDIFMLLSENQTDGDVEGFGIVALEANFYGIPVVGAKFCGVEDAVDNFKSGILVDGDNISEIYDAINYCLNNKDLLSSAMKLWVNNHNWNIIVKKYIEII